MFILNFLYYRSGGTTGFSTNINAVKRWEINASYRAALRTCFHKHLNFSKKKYTHPDLGPARITKDQQAVHEILDIMTHRFIDPISEQPLLSISTGILANDQVTKDMLSAKSLGEAAMKDFTSNRLEKDREKSFYDPIKLMKLGTFATMSKIKECKIKSKVIPLQATKDLFAKISLIAQIRSIDMRSIFQFPLGPLPWSLADPIGSLKKTSKSSLLHKLEGQVDPIESLQEQHTLIIDGMAYVQQAKVTDKTFGEFAMDLLDRILHVGSRSNRIDVVFDDYRDASIKNVERSRRSSGNLLFQSILPTTAIKQWGLFLSSGKNKNALVKFICSEWKKVDYLEKIASKNLFVTDGESVFNLSENSCSLVEELTSNHEEADTRMVLHAKHASESSSKILISSPDTDVFVICLGMQHIINANLFFLTGVKNSRRIIDITTVSENVYTSLNQCEASKDLILDSLIGLHSFTGCDTTSAFAGKGKVKPLNLMMKDIRYVKAFAELGRTVNIDDKITDELKRFVCHLYGWKETKSLQDVRYKMYCQSGGKLSCEKLPPCDDVLELHIKRANYQAFIWRQSLLAQQQQDGLIGNGWLSNEDGSLDIEWMRCSPAPDEVIAITIFDIMKRYVKNLHLYHFKFRVRFFIPLRLTFSH